MLVAQQRNGDAAGIMTPVVARRREVNSRNHGDCDVRFGLAAALYVQALVDGPRREALLSESATIISGLPREYRNLFATRYVIDRISDAQLGRYPWMGKTR